MISTIQKNGSILRKQRQIDMQKSYISFYLKVNKIHIYVDTLRRLGSPSRICFMTDANCRALLITPYEKHDLKSHPVPPEVYNGTGCMEVSSIKLCQILSKVHHWDLTKSYRVPGIMISEKNAALFNLKSAEYIVRSEVCKQNMDFITSSSSSDSLK